MKHKRILSLLLALCLALSMSVGAFASGEASEETADTTASGESSSASGEASGESSSGDYENRPVYATGVYEMESADAVVATYTLYGYYNTTDASQEDAFTVLAFTGEETVALYTDSSCEEEAEGVAASFDGETLTLTFDEAPEDEFYAYVLFDDGETEFTAVPVYVVSYAANEIYLNATTDYNGYTLRYDADEYTPGAVYYEEGTADAIIGGAIDLFSAEDFADEIAEAAETTGYDYDLLYAAVDWYLNNGATTGGDTWEEFLTDRQVNVNPTDDTDTVDVGDGYLRVEACYWLFRYYWMNNTTYEVAAGDNITGIFSDNMNKLFEDFNDFFWGHYYCTWFQALNPALRSGGLFKYDSIVDPDGSNTDEVGMYKYRTELGVEGQLAYEIDSAINWGDFLNMIYNAITGGQSALNEAGDAAAEALAEAAGDSREANAQAVIDYFGLDVDLDSVIDETVTKWDAVVVFYALKGTSDAAKEVPDDDTEDTYLYNTTKYGDLALDTYLDTATYYERQGIEEYTAETNHYGLTTMAAVTISDAATVDEEEWEGCTFFYVGDYVIILDNTVILDEADTGETSGTIYYQAGYSMDEYEGEKEYVSLAFSYTLEEDGTLLLEGVDGYDSFATGTSWNLADVGSFYCSGLWIRDGVQAELKNTTVLAQASGTGDDIGDDSHRFFGGGDGLQVTDGGTSVTVSNDDGQIFLIGTGSTAAGSIYAGSASTTVIHGTTLRNASGHPFSIFYNGILVLDNDTIMNSGRIFNSDASSGTVIFNNTICIENSGAAVLDETCSAYFVNTFVTKLSGWEVNGNSQAILTNTTVETGGSWNFGNKTSMSSDVGEVVLVNTSLLNTSGTIATASRGGRGYFHVVDSTIVWSGDADTTLFTVGGTSTWTSASLYVEVDAESEFPTAFTVAVAGDCYSSVRGWNDDELTFENNSTLYLDIDQTITVRMDCTDTVTCSFGMVGVTDKFYATGNVIFVEDGEYVYTGLDDSDELYNTDYITALADNGDGTVNVTYTFANGSTMTYENLPYTGDFAL
ncbi:MAG: hypothetical protein LUH42_03150 [Oscillospiraceae bacterium]|nr:hypothetical protein [Oscillospiraceae bacterium]